ncbi:MAG TPA: hypothetical protein VGR02_18500 [Thermoanaerobaculia bacterium]|nr:hypothetical protein [Thermoanaerobaculia bacterium]
MPEDYFTEIEAHFASRRNTPFILSAKDWALMKQWAADGVPLAVVIEAIDSVFEKNETSGRKRIISSLSYCKHAVKELWNERRELLAGAEGSVPEAAVADLVEALASDVAAVSRPFGDRIRALVAEKSVPRIEEQLIEVERELIRHLLETAPDADAIRAEVALAIGDASSLEEKTRERTIEANTRRIVRERFAVPRLTLFR